ncbi:hypothetical protein [Brunnivagina elsteri]|uniref:Cell division protein FtsL n=1 Tax=Brunnivagina elsteri CCALA 953 TaxID=987040 RepID=A0A2A2TD66_9CYAN|nr:hypothetical protein [Calothrix elsteri]PAX51694.1 hypothetical protein CK510_23420 [Calothrix elsteri CCALA 953]
MAAVRKSDIDTSTKGGWFRRKRSRLRENPYPENSQTISTNTNTFVSTSIPEKQQSSSSFSASGSQNTTRRSQSSGQASVHAKVPKTSVNPSNTKLNKAQPLKRERTKASLATKHPEARVKNTSAIPVMSAAETMPVWILRLHGLQRHTSVVSFVLVISTLIAYGWTVYSQQLWGKSYRRLQDLQRHERQLTITNGVLKSKMATDAEKPNSGLSSPNPKKTVFLDSTPGTTNSVAPNLPVNPIPPEQRFKPEPGY